MTLKQFIKEYREEIDKVIHSQVDIDRKINNEERRLWVLNDEGLYRWARSAGVKI